ncbi:MAG TPA: HoxN/HupN/NixA family nickel/cobalt transporter [Paraburkholderia sp.]|jgi:high-affinity nickel-transport protein
MYATLALVNLIAWALACAAVRASPMLLGTAFLAYSFGLRHAMDADHIAAIDNVTRKLMNDGQRPVTVGFFFALGHSLIVAVGAVVVAMATRALVHHLDAFRETGAMIGTAVSATFLLLIGAVNVVLLADLVRAFRRLRGGGEQPAANSGLLRFEGNLLARVFRPLFRLISASWLMLPLGILFGLGFETATEVALLGTSASQASAGFSIWTILVFPCLFAAGMLTVDTTDGILMLGAYGWAFVKPLRKLYYNVTITLISTIVAFLIGGIEALGIASQVFALSGPFWRIVDTLNDNFGMLGYAIVGIFVAGWLVSALLYKMNGYDRDAAAA